MLSGHDRMRAMLEGDSSDSPKSDLKDDMRHSAVAPDFATALAAAVARYKSATDPDTIRARAEEHDRQVAVRGYTGRVIVRNPGVPPQTLTEERAEPELPDGIHWVLARRMGVAVPTRRSA